MAKQRNGKVLSFRVSPNAAAYLSQGSQPTVTGTGSVARATMPVPQQYSVSACVQHGTPIGNTVLLGGLRKGLGYIIPYTPQLWGPVHISVQSGGQVYTLCASQSGTHAWCTQCNTWCLLVPHGAYVPRPTKPALTVTQQAAKLAAQANNVPFSPQPYGQAIKQRPGNAGNAAGSQPSYQGNAKSKPWWRKV